MNVKLITLRAQDARHVTQQDRRGICAGDVLQLPGGRLGLVRRLDIKRRTVQVQRLDVNRGQFDKANRAYSRFTGMKARQVEILPGQQQPSMCYVLGELTGVMYDATVDGAKQRYAHPFKKSARPHLASSHDGRQLYILGGGYRVTDQGIVDS